jgi:ABC-2 type transport system permease protein
MSARDTSRPLPLLLASRRVFGLAVDAMLLSRRSLLMAGLLSLPLAFALLYRIAIAAKLPPDTSGLDLYGLVVALYYVHNVVPLAALFFASALVADEVEARTLTYLVSRPIPRAAVVLGKFAAYVVSVLVFTLPANTVAFLLLGLLAYGAFFTLLGIVLKRPVIPGLFFLYGWELLANAPGNLPKFTLNAWLRALIRHKAPVEGLASLFEQTLPAGQGVLVLVGVSALLLWAAARIFSEREFVLDQ